MVKCFTNIRSHMLNSIFYILVARGLFDFLHLATIPVEGPQSLKEYYEQHIWHLRRSSHDRAQRFISTNFENERAPKSVFRQSKSRRLNANAAVLDHCIRQDSFEVDTDYIRGDMNLKGFNLSMGNPRACCQSCEALEGCTHWTFADSRCWLKSNPERALYKSKIISGRVSLDLYLVRKHLPVYSIQGLIVQACRENEKELRHYRTHNNPFIIVHEPRSGTNWLQKAMNTHPNIRVHFELDIDKGDNALMCSKCPDIRSMTTSAAANNTKTLKKSLPVEILNISQGSPLSYSDNASNAQNSLLRNTPTACGMTLFGSSNTFNAIADLAKKHQARLVLILRRNHVAHAISRYLQSSRYDTLLQIAGVFVPWEGQQLRHYAEDQRQAYERMVMIPTKTNLTTHVIFYEDIQRNPSAVWLHLQAFLSLEPVHAGAPPYLSREELEQARKPLLQFLQFREKIAANLTGTIWHEMLLTNSSFDEKVDLLEEFGRICALNPAQNVTWRHYSCVNGDVQ